MTEQTAKNASKVEVEEFGPEDYAWAGIQSDLYLGRATRLVWAYEPFFGHAPATEHHYPHKHPTNPGLILYTQSLAKGRRNIQTPIKPGRYLMRYYSDYLTEKQCAFYAAWQVTGKWETQYTNENAFPLAFAAEPDDIVAVYKRGPASCMKGMECVSVYGAGDLAVAYLAPADDDNRPIARCLVWPDKKVAGRVYPTVDRWSEDGFTSRSDAKAAHQALWDRLKGLGFKFDGEGGSFNGARLLKEKFRGGVYAMPYIDGDYGVNDDGRFWRMSDQYVEYSADNTDGELAVDAGRWTCDGCDGDQSVNYDDRNMVYTQWHSTRNRASGGEVWCNSCRENHSFRCEGTHDDYSTHSVDEIVINNRSYVQQWAEHEGIYQSDLSNEHYFDADDAPVTLANGEVWSTSEFEKGGFRCLITDDLFAYAERHHLAPDADIGDTADDAAVSEWLAINQPEKEEVE